ncbi:hypothetical protein D3C87_2082370 [compost metagenome]
MGRKTNGALANKLIRLAQSAKPGYISTNDSGPNRLLAVRTLLIPINSPPATIAGIIGTKISESDFTNR